MLFILWPLVDMQNDLVMHFVAMSLNGPIKLMVVMDKFSSSVP